MAAPAKQKREKERTKEGAKGPNGPGEPKEAKAQLETPPPGAPAAPLPGAVANPRPPGAPPLSPEAPQKRIPRAWGIAVWATGGAAALASVTAWAMQGLARTVALLLVLVFALALCLMASHPRLPAAGPALGGIGYQPPSRRRLRGAHAVTALLHNLGVLVVVVAGLARVDLIPVDFPTGVVHAFSLVLGVYVAAMTALLRWGIAERGGAVRTWFTRIHGWMLAAVAVGVTVLAVAYATRPGGLTDADVQVGVLAGALAAGTQVFLATGLPTFIDLARAVRDLVQEEKGPRGTPPIVYAAVLALGTTLAVGALLWRLDVVGQLGGFRNSRAALLLVLAPLGLALFFAYSALQLGLESRRGLFAKRLEPEMRASLTVYAASGLAGLLFSTLLAMNLVGALPDLGPIPAGRNLSKDLSLLLILSTTGPIGLHLHRKIRRVQRIEDRLPDFLNDLAESRRAGLTLTTALQSAAGADYGELTPEVRKMANQVAWGVPFTEALRHFALRVPTSLVQRSVFLIIEAGKTGGSVSEILGVAAKDAYELKGLQAERRATMATYLMVLYVVFFVFLSIIAVMDAQFIPAILRASESAAASDLGDFAADTNVDRGQLRFIYFNAAMMQALGNGIVAGVLAEGKATAGLRHAAIMALLSWLVMRILLPAF